MEPRGILTLTVQRHLSNGMNSVSRLCLNMKGSLFQQSSVALSWLTSDTFPQLEVELSHLAGSQSFLIPEPRVTLRLPFWEAVQCR